MPKIVYNACFGGFGLSREGIFRYAEIKGLILYPDEGEFGLTTYWTCPSKKRPRILEGKDFHRASLTERRTSNEAYSANTLTDRDIPRSDPALAQVVEELGDAANGRHAKLAIRELPEGVRYRIDEYDGNESVMTPDDYEWSVA